MSRHSERPNFVLRRRSSPATVAGGSLLDCGPFTHPSFTASFQDHVQPTSRSSAKAPSFDRNRTANWRQNHSTPGNSFSTFRQSRAALSPFSEHSDSDNSFQSSASNASTPNRSYKLMDLGEESTHPGSRVQSSSPASDVLEKFSKAFRISQRSPESYHNNKPEQRSKSVPPDKYNRDRKTLRGFVNNNNNNDQEESSHYISPNQRKLLEMKTALQHVKNASETNRDSFSRQRPLFGTLKSKKSPSSPSRRFSRKTRYASSNDSSGSKRGCCEKMCSFFITLAAVAVLASCCMFALRRLAHNACQQNQQLNLGKLTRMLQQRVYGQHIAVDALPAILRAHMKSESGSPIVVAFHGWTGIGKNFVSQMVSEQVPASTRHLVVIPMSYLPSEKDHLHREQIYSLIKNGSKQCAFNLFILDEVDKASVPFCEGLFEVVHDLEAKPFNNSRTLILLLSNSGGSHINQYVFNHLQEGNSRDRLRSKDLEPVILQALETAGDPSLRLYKMGLVNHIIPFLPLEAEHVRGCIQDYLRQNNATIPTGNELEELFVKVLGQLSFFPQRHPLFSKTGCRKVPVKVDLALG